MDYNKDFYDKLRGFEIHYAGVKNPKSDDKLNRTELFFSLPDEELQKIVEGTSAFYFTRPIPQKPSKEPICQHLLN